jgi:hypothetical protein
MERSAEKSFFTTEYLTELSWVSYLRICTPTEFPGSFSTPSLTPMYTWTANGMPPSANPTTSWNISFEHAQIHPHAHSGKIALKKHVLDSTTS